MAPSKGVMAMDVDKLVVKLKDDELAVFPEMPEDACGIRGDFLNCVTDGKYRLNISLPAGEICPKCGVYLKKDQ